MAITESIITDAKPRLYELKRNIKLPVFPFCIANRLIASRRCHAYAKKRSKHGRVSMLNCYRVNISSLITRSLLYTRVRMHANDRLEGTIDMDKVGVAQKQIKDDTGGKYELAFALLNVERTQVDECGLAFVRGVNLLITRKHSRSLASFTSGHICVGKRKNS